VAARGQVAVLIMRDLARPRQEGGPQRAQASGQRQHIEREQHGGQQ